MLRWSSKARHLSISEALLGQLDFPHVLIIERTPAGLVLYPRGDARATGKERKVNYPHRAMPRMSIGAQPAAELGLHDGRYAARVEAGTIVIEE